MASPVLKLFLELEFLLKSAAIHYQRDPDGCLLIKTETSVGGRKI